MLWVVRGIPAQIFITILRTLWAKPHVRVPLPKGYVTDSKDLIYAKWPQKFALRNNLLGLGPQDHEE